MKSCGRTLVLNEDGEKRLQMGWRGAARDAYVEANIGLIEII
jgi:hypothetical protein